MNVNQLKERLSEKMTLETALNVIDQDGLLFNIGQLSPATVRHLNGLAKSGKLIKTHAMWPHIYTGTCKKVVWTRADFPQCLNL